MKLVTIFVNLLSLVNSQMIVGSQRDDHNCVLDGGYQWCESLNQCIRIWETYCESIEEPMLYHNNDCSSPCPPPTPCPAPGPDCTYAPPIIDKCGCTNGCGTIDCNPIIEQPHSMIPKNCATWNDGCNTCEVYQDGTFGGCTLMYCLTQNTPTCISYYINEDLCRTDDDCDENKYCRHSTNAIKECVNYALENDSCGGFTLPGMQNICSPSLECVNTMGPMIADAPGICKPFCPNNERRDEYGNCITNGCQTWFDGCNSCQIGINGVYIACSRVFCETPQNAECRDNILANKLRENDICYRFCENGFEPPINRRNDCPPGTECIDSNTIGFDSCGERASICVRSGH